MNPYFTVYTPTFNRAQLLPRVYESLLIQDDHDFEWLVIDDGSDDDTETMVRGWIENAPFPVRYWYQTNQGKHMATNRAVEMAAGEMFVIVDSDDWLAKGALREIRAAWETIPDNARYQFSGVAGLFVDPGGKPCTKPFPHPNVDSNMVEIVTKHKIRGEISVATRTEVRRLFPFPEDVGTFCMETLVWNRIAQLYKIRFVNKTLQIKDYQECGLTKSGMHRRMVASPAAYILRSNEYLALKGVYIPYRHRAIAVRLLICAYLHAGVNLRRQFIDSKHKLLWLSQVRKGLRDYYHHLASLKVSDS